jgi:hypothetical protein
LLYSGQVTEAKDAITRAWDLAGPHIDEEPVLLAHVATVMALVEAELGRGEEAERFALEAVKIRRPFKNEEYHARSDIALGAAKLAKGEPHDALRWLDDGIVRRERVYGSNHALLVYPLRLRARARAAANDEVGAREDAERAEEIQARFLPEMSSETG